MEQINQTRNYDLFELCPINRAVDETKKSTEKLEQSMRKYGWLSSYPMDVISNGMGKLKIRSGHHRFRVARKLNIPVKYVISKVKDVSIHELEHSTSRWTLKDYLISYSRNGNYNYIVAKEYVDKTGIGISAAISMLGGQMAGSKNFHQAFIEGRYKVAEDTVHANHVAAIVSAMKKVGFHYATNDLLTQAISRILLAPEVDYRRLRDKIIKHKHFLERKPSLIDYQKLLEDIYNRGSGDKVPIAFFADEEARRRTIAFRKKY